MLILYDISMENELVLDILASCKMCMTPCDTGWAARKNMWKQTALMLADLAVTSGLVHVRVCVPRNCHLPCGASEEFADGTLDGA